MEKPCKVLIVDDDKDTADSLFLVMKEHGSFEPYVAYCAEYELHFVSTAHPDVIILDLGMPGMDGYNLGRRMKAANPSSTIIVVSGHGGREFQVRSIEAGFDHHLVKPVEPQKLFSLISTTVPAGSA